MSKCLRRGHGGLIPLCFEEAARTDTYGGRWTMANGKLLRQLIRSGAEGDLGSFRGAARRVIEEERQKQHLCWPRPGDHSRRPPLRAGFGSAPAAGRDHPAGLRRAGSPLLAVHGPARHLEDVVLAPRTGHWSRKLSEHRYRTRTIGENALPPTWRSSARMCGDCPPSHNSFDIFSRCWRRVLRD